MTIVDAETGRECGSVTQLNHPDYLAVAQGKWVGRTPYGHFIPGLRDTHEEARHELMAYDLERVPS